MLCIDNIRRDPYFNLALEEYVLKNFTENIFMLWINNPAIIVGKNQNTLAEINADYIKEHNIPVVRRLSGGGAVFHDPGNINFTFIMPNTGDSFTNFKIYTKPIIDILAKLGIDAKLSGRNDLTINDQKFSGNAQYIYKNRILHHGTLLFSSDMSHLANALKVDTKKIESKGIKSIRSRVTNIESHLKENINIESFKDMIMNHVKEGYGGVGYTLTTEDIIQVEKMAKERYSTWEWNYGYSPQYNFSKERRFFGGNIETHLNVQNGLIQDCKIYGDFFSEKDISDIEKALVGNKHSELHVLDVLSQFDIDKYFANISLEDVLSVFY
ncbi:MAG: lipoate--protein ligase [Clostridiales bacterium]|nr:lipoate--protein ligase [Clostridiales bacterium]